MSEIINPDVFHSKVDLHHHEKGGLLYVLTRPLAGRLLFREDHPVVRSLFEELTHLTAVSFGGVLDESSSDGTSYHLQDVDLLVIVYDEQGPVGFASGFYREREYFYLHGVAVSERVKVRGVAKTLIKLLWDASEQRDIVFTTQNPIMYCMLRSICEAVHPAPGSNTPSHFVERFHDATKSRGVTGDPAKGTIVDLYGRCLYPELPKSWDDNINTWFRETLRGVDGQTRDGFVLMGTKK